MRRYSYTDYTKAIITIYYTEELFSVFTDH
jgi:hypothetical protein